MKIGDDVDKPEWIIQITDLISANFKHTGSYGETLTFYYGHIVPGEYDDEPNETYYVIAAPKLGEVVGGCHDGKELIPDKMSYDLATLIEGLINLSELKTYLYADAIVDREGQQRIVITGELRGCRYTIGLLFEPFLGASPSFQIIPEDVTGLDEYFENMDGEVEDEEDADFWKQ